MSRRPGFTGSRIDRADHLRLDAETQAALRTDPKARLLGLDGADPVLDEEGRLLRTPIEGEEALIFLGLDGETPLFAPIPKIDAAQRGWTVFHLLSRMSPDDAALWAAARSLIAWHGRHGFCANCGAPTMIFRAGWGRKCGTCAAEHFPRVDPVVIMLAQYEGRVLLARQPQYPPHRYSALAGFVEPGESIEEAVAREIREESGLAVSNVEYVASQPWPFPGQLMIACIADAATDAVVLDRTELEDSLWASPDDVRSALERRPGARFEAPPHFAIAHSLLLHWLERSDRLAADGMAA